MAKNKAVEYSIIAKGALHFIDYEIDLSMELEDKTKLCRKSVPFHIHSKDGDIKSKSCFPMALIKSDDDQWSYVDYNKKGQVHNYDIKMQEAFECCCNHWLPMPFLASNASGELLNFGYGPTDWARAYLSRLGGEDSLKYRLTVVFDPQVEDNSSDILTKGGIRIYHALSESDASQNVKFSLIGNPKNNRLFCQLPWVREAAESCRSAYRKNGRLRQIVHDLENYDDDQPYQPVNTDDLAAYITFLHGLELSETIGQVRVIDPTRVNSSIDVKLVLDIGNSRMTGMLVETIPQQPTKLTDCYPLPIRDLSKPAKIYRNPVETRVEFSEPYFGKREWSRQSRRHDSSFRWPSIVRLGPEAIHLAQGTRENRGPTGMSSPKRYLWDTRDVLLEWYLNNRDEHNGADEEMAASIGVFLNQITDYGIPLEAIKGSDGTRNFNSFLPKVIEDIIKKTPNKYSAAESKYSRSSIMMFLLSEVIAQALSAINNPDTRKKHTHDDIPRRLTSIILTLPTAMPLIEQTIFKAWAQLAVRAVWSALGWDDYYGNKPGNKKEHNKDDFRRSPTVHCDWDEATCTQVVWLYNEICGRFQGNAGELFDLMGRKRLFPHTEDNAKSLRIASIDMGGGTTDLSVSTYYIVNKSKDAVGTSTLIRPHTDFRDGFNIAGDDILQKIIVSHFLAKIAQAASEDGVDDAYSKMARLFKDAISANDEESHEISAAARRLRARFVKHVAVPVALHILEEYEKFDTFEKKGKVQLYGDDRVFSFRIGDALKIAPTSEEGGLDDILQYLNEGLGWPDCNLLERTLEVDMVQVDENVNSKVEKIMADMGEVVKLYDCDLLILTGRPSCWPAMMRAPYHRLCLSADRVTHMHQYGVADGYPFEHHGCIKDPKTTVVVGAMICALAKGSLEGFSLDTSMFEHQPTTRYLGILDNKGKMSKEKVLFEDIDVLSSNTEDESPTKKYDLSAAVAIGFRQLATPRWTTTRLYRLEKTADDEASYTVTLKYTLDPYQNPLDPENEPNKPGHRRTEGRLEIVKVEIPDIHDESGLREVYRAPVQIRLQTLPDHNGYWLDTGLLDVEEFEPNRRRYDNDR